ncbi:MAG: M56 and DUF3738 domain-containing protein, partial [Terriglobia bacterium]
MISVLANHLWQSTVFAAAAGLLAFALRNNRAQTRYWVWLVASLKFLVPFSWMVALGGLLAPSTAVPAMQPELSVIVNQISQPFTAPAVSVAAVHPTANPVPIILFAIWLCGFLVVVFRWWTGWRRIRAAVRVAGPLGIQAGVPVLSCTALLEPGIFGIFRPVLLLPEGIAEHLTRAQFEAILAHELCHVRRRDNLFAALHMLVEAIFWFHPLVWWIGARLVEERERACDEEVLRQGNEPQVYAESILKTCQLYLESPLACMSGVTGSDLKKRVVRIMTQRVGHRIGFARKALLAAAGALAVAGPLLFGLMNAPEGRAQTTAAEPSGAKPKFEVASIKPDKSGRENLFRIRVAPGYRFYADNITPQQLIEIAYQVKDSQLTGGPNWINSTHYDIEAKPSDSLARSFSKLSLSKLSRDQGQQQLRQMLQSLLADRFKLRLSRATKELPIYALVVAKHGPKVHPVSTEPARNASIGRKNRMARMGRGELYLKYAPLTMFADMLSRRLGRIVVDETGLKGNYDFTLKWTPDESQNRMFQGPPGNRNQPMGNPAPPPETSGPSVFTAIQEQLGLKLKAEKGPVEVLVIDHVEQPSP